MDEKKQSQKFGRDKRMRARLTAKFNSIKEWRNYCFNTHSSYLKNKHFRKWINGKEIFIFNFSNLSKNSIRHIKSGIEDAIKLGKLHFKVRYANHGKFGKVVRNNSKKINSNKLLKMIVEERKGNHKEHADVFILNSQIQSPNAVIKNGEALTYVPEGVIMFTFDVSKKYPYKFLRRRAKHEALHMLGLNAHHGDTEVKGYDYNAACIMQYNAPAMRVCGKCRDALLYFWKGIKYATKK